MLPNYLQTWGLAQNFGAKVRGFALHAEAGWEPAAEEVRSAIAPGTKLVVVTNPHNPTGHVLSDAMRRLIVARAAEVGAWLLADEVYQGAERDGATTPSLWGSYERVIVVSGLSKAYGLPGLRIGWVLGPPACSAEAWARHDYTTIGPAGASDHLAAVALEPRVREKLLDRTRRILKTNYPVLEAWLQRFGDTFTWNPPQAGAICLVKYRQSISALELVEKVRAELHVKGAHLRGARHIVLKLATGFYQNRARGLPSGDGMFLLLDAETGAPDLLLEEHGYLTDLRTAAAVALTLKYLAPQDARDARLVGAGALARLTARAMIAELPLERLTLWNRTPERADALAKELASVGATSVAPALEHAVRDHRIVVTATASTTPLIKAAWVTPGMHITSVGTGSPEKMELEPDVLRKADKLIADRVSQAERYGNLHHALAAGVVTRETVYGELGELAVGRLAGREAASEITVADLTGVGGQDAAIAQAVVEVLGL